jgi:hypothetical protein
LFAFLGNVPLVVAAAGNPLAKVRSKKEEPA